MKSPNKTDNWHSKLVKPCLNRRHRRLIYVLSFMCSIIRNKVGGKKNLDESKCSSVQSAGADGGFLVAKTGSHCELIVQ